MKANRAARERTFADEPAPDGGQMLLLAGFLIAATAIMAIGAFTMLERTETQVSVQEHQTMLNLFMNTRDRAKAFFEIVTANDTASSVGKHLDGYLFSQFQTAHSLSLQLNATLAGIDQIAPKEECEHFVDANTKTDCDTSDNYVDPDGGNLWSTGGEECYSGLTYDGKNDGLIEDANGDVVGAIFWLKVESTDASLEEYVIIDVPPEAGSTC